MTLVGLPQREKGSACAEPFMSLVGRTGFEPVTNGLKVRIRVLLKINNLAQLGRSRPQLKAVVRCLVCLPVCLPISSVQGCRRDCLGNIFLSGARTRNHG
jgi:hypothetical protein